MKNKTIDQSGFTKAMEEYLIGMVNETGKKLRHIEQFYAKNNTSYKEDKNKFEGRLEGFNEALMFLAANRKDVEIRRDNN